MLRTHPQLVMGLILLQDCQYQVLMAMYYLSRISNTRQEQLARSSVTPHLQRFISQNHPMKQFALPILIQVDLLSGTSRSYADVMYS